jgi:amino acid adenylation domain-containing protein
MGNGRAVSTDRGGDAVVDSDGGLSPAARALLARRATLDRAVAPAAAIHHRSEPSRSAPLSSWQQSIWFLDQMEPGSDVYNRAKRLRLTGALDVAALRASLAEIFRRHEVLRSRIVMEDGRPAQCVMTEYEFALPLIDLGDLPPAQRDATYSEVATAAARAPFELGSGPWARAALVREAPDVHVLLFTAHHIAFDGWSTEVLFTELADLYRAFAASGTPHTTDPAFQYADFATWERERLRSSALDADIDYWVTKLRGAPPLLELPADHPRQDTTSSIAGEVSAVIPAVVAERLLALGREENATLFMTLFAAFQLFLSRMCGQEDVVVGIPVAGRASVATERMIGCFINVLPLRTFVAGQRCFRELLRDVRSCVLGGFTHQDAPFDAIVERSGVGRSMAHSPLTQVLFNFRNMPAADLSFAGLCAKLESVDAQNLVSDLEIEIEQRGDDFRCVARYDAALFNASTVQRWIGHFQTLLDGVVALPGERVSRIPLLTASERHQLVVEWNSAATTPDYETCLHRLVEAQVHRTPDAIAVFDENESLTYASMNRRANILARDLVARGVGPDVLVGVNMERCVDLAPALLGILKAGGAYVPLDPEYPADRLAYMLSDSQPVVMLSQRTIAGQCDAGTTPTIYIDAEYWAAALRGHDSDVASDATPDSLAYVIYTSGSTGRPKGAMNTHRGVCNALLRSRDMLGVSASDVTLLRTPLSFDFSVKELFSPLIVGGSVAVARATDSADPQYLARAIDAHGVTIFGAVPTVLQGLLDVPDVSTACSRIRVVDAGGEAMSRALLKRYFAIMSADIYNICGPTETAVDALAWKCERNDHHRSVPVGRPVINNQIYILDGDGEPVPIGVGGEIYIGGVGVGRGYLNRPELTATQFLADQFRSEAGARLYRSGDLGRFDVDGLVEITGRADDQVKIRGIRIELGEIESLLSSIDGVRECAVVMRDDAPGGRGLVAYVVATDGVVLSDGALRETLGRSLLPAMVPAAFVTMDSLPRTPSEKIDRRSLPAPVACGSRGRRSHVMPGTSTEKMVAAVWAEVLQQDRIFVDDDFFELGGHSLGATQVMSRIRRRAGVAAPLKILFEHPTVRTLAAAVDELSLAARPNEERPLTLAKTGDGATCIHEGVQGRAPLFLFHGDYVGGGLYVRQLVKYFDRELPVYVLDPHRPGGPETIAEMAADLVPSILQVQPAGPYRLIGYCNGGAVALEAASHLQSRGEHIAFLGVIDLNARNVQLASLYRAIGHVRKLFGFRRRWQVDTFLRLREPALRFLETELPPIDAQSGVVARVVFGVSLASLIVRRALRRAWRFGLMTMDLRSRNTGGPPSLDQALDPEDQERRLQEEYMIRAMSSYVPRPYPGVVTIIGASEREIAAPGDQLRHWRAVAEHVDAFVIPGTHASIVTSDIAALGELLRAQIARVG